MPPGAAGWQTPPPPFPPTAPKKGRGGILAAVLVVGLLVVVGSIVGALALLGSSEDDTTSTGTAYEDRSAPVRPERQGGEPQVGDGRPALGDHWHAAFGVNVCGSWYPDPVDVMPDHSGIHTHEDGVIHIHPFSTTYTGAGANLGVFFEMVDIEVDGEQLFVEGMDFAPRSEVCRGEPGRWVLARFEPDVSDEAVELIDDPAAFAATRFLGDREAFTLAWLPEGETVPPPPSVPMLDRLSDVPPGYD